MRRFWIEVSLAFAVALFAVALPASADTLELKDGRVLNGRYLGGTAAQVRFEINGNVEVFRVSEVVALTFTGRSSAASPASPPAASSAPGGVASTDARSADSATSAGGRVTVPAGTRLLVRMIDGVDSSKNHVGDRFHASMETDLVVGDTVVARKGTDLYGRLAEAKQAGHVAGSSELKLELTDMVVNGQSYPLMTGDYEAKGKGRGGNTAEKVGGGAALGAIIGAIAGGGKGAAIGAGVGAGAGGAVQVMTRGEQVRVPSETLLEFRLEQPVTVTLAGSSRD
jgi:hypothetical protein